MRALTLICAVLFLITGFFAYQVPHQVDVLDMQIKDTRLAAAQARAQTKVLETDWGWLNRQERLQPFADRFLNLSPVTPSQYVPLTQLASRLPTAGSSPIPAAQAENMMIAANNPKPVPAALVAKDAAPAAPVQLADASPAQPVDQVQADQLDGDHVSADLVAPNHAVADHVDHSAGNRAAAAPVKTLVAEKVRAPAATKDTKDARLAALVDGLRAGATAKPAAKPVRVAYNAPQRRVYTPRTVYTAPARPVYRSPATTQVAYAAPIAQSTSSLGMAQSVSGLPAPVAVHDNAWRNDQ